MTIRALHEKSSFTAGGQARSYTSRFGAQLTPPRLRQEIMQQLAGAVGNVMWDVGAGSGAIAIEWKIARPYARVFAIERYEDRCEDIAYNAFVHDVHVDILRSELDSVPTILPVPDMIWLGCPGESEVDLFEPLWAHLEMGGWMACNAVSLRGVQRLRRAHEQYGGTHTIHSDYDLPRELWIACKG
jgi:precorrin-6Y C5,15-methyltransferase (decarboxylating)